MRHIDQAVDFSYAIPGLLSWQRRFIRFVERIYGERGLYKTYRRFLECNNGPETFWEDARGCLDTEVRLVGREMPMIPSGDRSCSDWGERSRTRLGDPGTS